MDKQAEHRAHNVQQFIRSEMSKEAAGYNRYPPRQNQSSGLGNALKWATLLGGGTGLAYLLMRNGGPGEKVWEAIDGGGRPGEIVDRLQKEFSPQKITELFSTGLKSGPEYPTDVRDTIIQTARDRIGQAAFDESMSNEPGHIRLLNNVKKLINPLESYDWGATGRGVNKAIDAVKGLQDMGYHEGLRE